MMILLVGTISAMDWDNVKSYDEETKTITVINALNLPLISYDIAKIQLITPSNYKVPRGYQKVAEFKLYDFEKDYNNAFKNMNFYQVNSNSEEFERDFDYKYLDYVNEEQAIYGEVCGDKYVNGTLQKVCETKEIDKEIVQVPIWIKFNDVNELPNNQDSFTIGIFTIVEKGDKVEWIPTFFGVKINEWAIWTEELNVGLGSYFKLNDNLANTTIIDETSNHTGVLTVNSDTLSIASGKIDRAINLGAGANYINLTDPPFYSGDTISVGGWVKLNSNSSFDRILSKDDGGTKRDLIFGSQGTSDGFIFGVWATGQGIASSVTQTKTNTWYFVVGVYNSTHVLIYTDGVLRNTDAVTGNININADLALEFGRRQDGDEYLDGVIDEWFIYDRALSQAEITQLYNSGTGMTHEAFFPPVIILNFPVDTFNTTNPTTIFNGTVYDTSGNDVVNVSLYIDGILNETNSSGINNTDYIFTKTLSDGSYNWTYEACNNISECRNTTVRILNVNTTPNIQFENPTPINEYNSTVNYFTVNVSITETYFTNLTFYLYNSSGLYKSTTYTDLTRHINWTGLPDDKYSYNVTMWTNTSQSNSTETRNITTDATPPKVLLLTPPLLVDYHLINTNLSINWSTNDTNLDTCILQFEGTNRTLTCSDNHTQINITNPINRSIIFYVNDTFGRLNFTSRSWNYSVFENGQEFNDETLEGIVNTFTANVTIEESNLITIANFIYNGTSHMGSFSQSGNDSILTINFLAPNVATDTNLTFFWSLTLLDSQIINITLYNQTVIPISLDNCSVNTVVLYNYTVVDEGNQSLLSNTTTELNINLLDTTRQDYIFNFSLKYSNINPFAVCINKNLSSSAYAIDTIVKYEATGYVIEYYNIVNAIITNLTIPQNITLYDLFSADSTDFKITFKAEDFTFVENALIFIDRQYIAENNSFKTVELPKTDSSGQTIGHFVRNDVIYNIRVIKDGVVLGNFKNKIAFCEDFTIGNCQMILEAIPEDFIIFNYDEQLGIIFQSIPTYNENTSAISFDFSTDDGTIKTVLMEVTRDDIFGNRSICNNTLTSSSGTLSCSFDPNIDDSVLRVNVFVDGQQVVISNVKLETSVYGNLGYVLWFFLTFFFILLFGNSKTEVLIGLAISFIGAISLGITRGNIIGLGSAGIWVLVIIILGIWKLNKENPQ